MSKILVLSDSHSALSFMRLAIKRICPDVIIHLGDHFDDGEAMAHEFSHIPLHQVPGNCDRFRCLPPMPEQLCYDILGVRIFMTHGHLHGVKSNPYRLIAQARAMGAKAALYGHTHAAWCSRETGLWVLNPGSCGSYGGSVGLIEVSDGQITDCRILKQEDFAL